MVILRCVLPQWDLRFPSYKCLKKDIFSRYILTPTKFNCTLGHAQILEQIPKKSPNFFWNGIIMMKYLIQTQDLIPHVLRPLHFRHRIKALLRPSTNANLCYLRFDLTNCSWEKNCQNCISSATRSVEVAKLPQRNPLQYLFQWKGQKSTLSPSFITFSEREPFLRGFLCWEIWGFWSQRCVGFSKTCDTSFGRCLRKLTIV